MKNGTIRFIPLQSDLCLNKQKVDITDFKGWQKCNAPVYGDCLSPLYKKSDTHHDIYIGNDTYDFSQGKLYKNGLEVLSGAGTSKLKKTKVEEDYRTLHVAQDGGLTWAKITSGTSFKYSLHGNTSSDMTLNASQSIIEIKAFGNSEQHTYGIVVLYIATNGKIGYFVVWEVNGVERTTYGEGDPTLWEDFDVQSPLIQIGVYNQGEFLISFFSNSGADVKQTEIKNVYIKADDVFETVIFEDASTYADRYRTLDDGTDIKITVESINGNGAATAVGFYTYGGFVLEQKITVETARALSYPLTIAIKYLNADGEYVQRNSNETITLAAGETSATRTVRWSGLMKMNYIGGLANKTARVDVSANGGSYETTTIGSEYAQVYGCYISKINEEYKPSLVFDVTYTSDAEPDNPVSAPNLVNKTVRIGEEVTSGTDGFESSGLVMKSYTKSYTEVGNTFSVTDQWGLDTMINRISNAKSTSAKGVGTNFVGDRPHCDWGNSKYYFDSYTFDPYLDTKTYPMIVANGGVTRDSTYPLLRYVKQLYAEQALAQVDCCMDSGLLFRAGGLPLEEGEQIPTKMFALSGTFDHFDTEENKLYYNSNSTFNITYNASESINVYPRYYMGMNLSLSNFLLRTVFKFKAKKDDKDFIYIMIDSIRMEEGNEAAYLFPGVTTGTEKNIQGGAKNTTTTNGWRFLFNNNLLSNVACYEKSNYIGTILADWFSIDDRFCPAFNNNVLYYKDATNTIWKIEKTNNPDWEYKFIENRYIVLNTTNYYNCYDTQTGLKRHWASDYNNRIVYGFGFTYFAFNDTFKKHLTAQLFNGLIITGQNANYEQTKDTITGLELGAIKYSQCLADIQNLVYCDTPFGAIEEIDLYMGEGESTAAIYIKSFSNGVNLINTDLTNPDAVYPIPQGADIRYNPNLFTQFITSYNNKDMVISDGVAYRLVYYNNVVPVMAYYLLDGVEALENAFVLQTSYYGVSKTRLYQMNYSNGVGVEVVCDITNMEYLGALPTQALFWSAQNRAIYSFKGNCIMQLTQYANDLTNIFGKWYNPATQELFLDTNIGILVFSDLGTYCLEWAEETEEKTIKDIFFFEDYFIINLMNDVEYSHYYSYNNKEGYESNKVYFITKYYGNGLVPITVNNIYVRLYDQADTNAEGFIKMKGYTITDKGTQTDTKEVLIGGTEGEEWDSETGTMLVKYTPQFNRGLGFALELETTFPIIDIKFDYVENGTIESQIAHINI